MLVFLVNNSSALRLITKYDNILLQFTIPRLLRFSKGISEFTTTVITIYDRYCNSRHYYNSRQNKVLWWKLWLLLVFSVTPFKIDKNNNQNLSIDKVQNLGNERRYIYKDPRQDSGQRNISYTRYPKKCFTQTYRDLYGDAMLVLTWMSSNMADGNQQKHLLPSLLQKREFTPRGTHKH